MDSQLIETLITFAPALAVGGVVFAIILLANFLVRRNQAGELSVARQFLMICLTTAGLIVIIFSLPISETGRGQVLSLLGIVITAVIALSSTTFVSNVMAGLMLRAVNSFRPGDFIRCQDHFGRVTERGIFHTEIQTEDRDLATLPNLFLVNNPVTVVLSSGTIISANLTLGYDLQHKEVEKMLLEAAERTGLQDSFVLVGDLNDFSVSYRIAGFSDEVTRVLTTKSTLRKNILNVIHESGHEIVSPNFMNTRTLDAGSKIIPVPGRTEVNDTPQVAPEDVIFDKADSAAERELFLQEFQGLKIRLKEIAAEQKEADKVQEKALDEEESQARLRLTELSELLDRYEEAKENGSDS